MDTEEKEISLTEKKVLIDDILSTKPFLIRGKEVRGQRAREILAYLFNRYSERPSRQVTERDLFLDVFREEPDPENTKVRSAVVRLRQLLARYFHGRGARGQIQVTIPTGSYSLEFTRNVVQRDVFDWFWGPYLIEQQTVAFGIIPHTLHGGDPHGYVRTYARFAEMMSDHALDLEVLPRVLPSDFFSEPGPEGRLMSIFIGGEDALVRDRPGTFSSENNTLRFLTHHSSVNYTMFRDPAGRTAISSNRSRSDMAATFVDNETKKYVLFTRAVAVQHCTTVSLVMARHLDSCAAVAEFLTSSDGLQIIASHPRFNQLGSRLFSAPLELQIVFATSSKESDDHCYTSTITEKFNHVELVGCDYQYIDGDEDEGGYDF